MNLAAIALAPGSQPKQMEKPAFLTARGAVSNVRFQQTVFSYVNGLVRLGLKPGDKIFFG